MRTYAIRFAAATALALSPLIAAAVDIPKAQLEQEVANLDYQFFDGFNRCDQPGMIDAHATLIDPKLEFYHDQGGATFSREAYLDGVRKNVCGKFARELVPGTLKVYPIKDYGAYATGTHRFCHFDTGRCEGEAEFAMLWHLDEGMRWMVTRVVSFGHRDVAGRPLPLATTPMPKPRPTPARPEGLRNE
jgi:hypothetical protein